MADSPKDFASICESIDGVNLGPLSVKRLREKRMDDVRLKCSENVLLSTYPRTGTTWLSQIVSLMMATDYDYNEMKKNHLFERVLFLEHTYKGCDRPEIDRLEEVPVPRALKTHLPYRFIRRWIDEDNVKTIITTRNPKSTLVSLYHFNKENPLLNFTGTWDEFFKLLQAGKMIYGDQHDWLKDWNDNRHKGTVLFVQYEAMKRDLKAELKRIAKFLELDISESRMEKVCQDSSITAMKSSETSGSRMANVEISLSSGVVRSGNLGEWKKYFTVEQNEWFDAKYKKLYEDLAIDVEYE